MISELVDESKQQIRQSIAEFDDEIFYTPAPYMERASMANQPKSEAEQIAERIMDLARNFKPFPRKDEYRAEGACKEGGFALTDPVVLSKFRSAFKDLIAQVGRMLLTGKFELYKVSFPIKAMSPVSILRLISTCSLHSPFYLNAAASTKDPIERMKFVMTLSLSYVYPTHCFDKPLNPILGETY